VNHADLKPDEDYPLKNADASALKNKEVVAQVALPIDLDRVL
jgi:hypothetical protein